MITPEDYRIAENVLRSAPPQSVVQEIGRWTSAYHAAGQSGPIGAIGVLAVLSSIGHGWPDHEAKATDGAMVDWRNLPSNGTVAVEAYFFGAWQPGVFRGVMDGGTLAVKLHDDENVKECRRHMLRLATVDQLQQVKESREQPAAASLYVPAAEAEAVTESTEEEGEAGDIVSPDDASDWEVDDGSGDSEQSPDWATVAPNAAVWVEVDGSPIDGHFLGVTDDGKLKVRLKGTKKHEAVSPIDVRLATA